MHSSLSLPNALSLLRILLAPVLIMLALNQMVLWYWFLLMCSIGTDLLDGFLARYLKQVSRLGSQLDSWGDFCIYTSMAGCAWILWPDIFVRESFYIAVFAACCVIPALVGAIKFSTLTSYHTWATKLSVAVAVIGYLLLFTGITALPFRMAMLLAIYAAVEEAAITIVMPIARADIRSIWRAFKYANPEP